MTDGKLIMPISQAHLLEEYFTSMRIAHRNMNLALKDRSRFGKNQTVIASLLNVDKSIISKRFSGGENLTLKTLSFMASAMDCRLIVTFQPYEDVPGTNHYSKHFDVEMKNADYPMSGASGYGAWNRAHLDRPELWSKNS